MFNPHQKALLGLMIHLALRSLPWALMSGVAGYGLFKLLG